MRKMKDSGIEWIGEIPEKWELGAIKNAYSIILGKMLSPIQTQHEQTLENYLCAANVKWNGIDTRIRKKMWLNKKEKQLYRLQSGDILIMEGGLAGTSCLYRGELTPCYIQNSVHCCRAKENFVNRFLYYWMNVVYNSGYIDNICNKATIQHYTKEKVQNTPFVIVPYSEQHRIADYLDRKCGQIDAIIARQQEVIEKLKAYKRSVITEAVTKGLDPNVPMKDSGIEWIGKIPSDWEIKRVKAVLCERNITNNPIQTNKILSLTNDRGVIPYEEKGDIGNKSKEDLTGYKLAYPGDIVLNSMNIFIGSVALSSYFGCVSPVYYMLYPRDKRDSVSYFNYLFQTKGLQTKLHGYGNGIMEIRMRIQISKLNTVPIPVSPHEEQHRIADYLDRTCGQIDATVSRKQALIEKLKAYKKSLIYEVMTGKKEV